MKTFCCGSSLKTGCLAIGYFYMVIHALMFTGCFVKGIELHFEEGEQEYENYLQNKALSKLLFVLCFLVLKSLCINLLYLVGVYKDKAAYILPWLIWILVKMILQGISIAFSTALFNLYITQAHLMSLLFFLMCIFVLEIYVVTVISSFYHHLKKKPSLLDQEHELF